MSLFAHAPRWSAALGPPGGATLSECGLHRYLLWRTFDGARTTPLVFGMLNPSTADANKNDPTITRCLGFARREGAGGIIVVNLSPFRATDPQDLLDSHEAGIDVFQASENRAALDLARSFSTRFVLAWGAGIRPWLDGAARAMRQAAGAEALCLGRTKMGEPRHPLMLRADTPLERFVRAAS